MGAAEDTMSWQSWAWLEGTGGVMASSLLLLCLSVPFCKVKGVAPWGNDSSFLICISRLYDQNKLVFMLPLLKVLSPINVEL